jgi:hypothetical protein
MILLDQTQDWSDGKTLVLEENEREAVLLTSG